MGIEVKTFVDTHCHMFTVADVPLYAIIERQISHPLRMLVGSLISSVAVKWYERFIKYFDSETVQNMHQVVNELDRAIKGNNLGKWKVTAQERILTPLVMDFDLNGEVRKFEAQMKRLTDASSEFRAGSDDKSVRILPFAGLDPRKLIYKNRRHGTICGNFEIINRVNNFLEAYDVKPAPVRRDRTNLKNGDFIGVKIYPPLGFDIYPDRAEERNAFLTVYERLAELDIPITAHCQEASFDLTDGQLKSYTDPKNWSKVLDSSKMLEKLRINLGHFGGEKGVVSAVDWVDDEDDTQNISRIAMGTTKRGWTHEIIMMLKRYDNTYADISAFNFKDDHAVASLLWILAYDRQGKFDDNTKSPNYPIENKLMWGSDYPMILDKNFRDYSAYFGGFINSIINRKDFRKRSPYPVPEKSQLPASGALLRRMISTNPVNFLFG